ncbi:MAG: DUF6465 family protein [Faecalibacillus sp.]
MKTIIEVQYSGTNVTDKDLDKYVKESLKAEGVKSTDVETLNVYYVPESAKLFYVATKKDGAKIEGELDVKSMPDYTAAPVKKTPARKACAPKKASATKAEKTVAKATTTKATVAKKTTAKKTTKK